MKLSAPNKTLDDLEIEYPEQFRALAQQVKNKSNYVELLTSLGSKVQNPVTSRLSRQGEKSGSRGDRI